MSTITIYKTSRIIPSRNLKIDDLEAYLSTIPSETFADFQYIRPRLDGVIKINKGQEYAFWDSFVYDYLKVVNGNGEKTQYYFITKTEQKSEETLELTLHMDVINTFEGAYEISPNSVIHREFKDRWKRVRETRDITVQGADDHFFKSDTIPTKYEIGTTVYVESLYADDLYSNYPEADFYRCRLRFSDGTVLESSRVENHSTGTRAVFTVASAVPQGETPSVTYRMSYIASDHTFPVIDYLSEGIEPQLYKNGESVVQDKAQSVNEAMGNMSWNLVYKGENEVSVSDFQYVTPVQTYLVPDLPVQIRYSPTSGTTKGPSDFASGEYTWLSMQDGTRIYANTNKGRYVLTGAYASSVGTGMVDSFIYSDGSTIRIVRKDSKPGEGSAYGWFGSQIRGVTSITFETDLPSIPCATMLAIPDARPKYEIQTKTLPFSAVEDTCNGISAINLSQSSLMKVIKLPYCPSPISYENGIVSLPDWGVGEYSVGERMFKGASSGEAYHNRITADFLADPIGVIYDQMDVDMYYADKHLAWDKQYETKLYHSDFHQPKFVYDSFSFQFELEKIDYDEWKAATTQEQKDSLVFDFYVTSTVNSRFLFRFPSYILGKSQSDYDNVLAVSRNNEVTIYSNQYMNYLKTGYNYDTKNKDREKTMTGFSIVNTALGTLSPIAELKNGTLENPFADTAGRFSSAITSAIGNIMKINQAEEALTRKREQLSAQATSVSGSNDLDLLVVYSNNKAKLVYYNPSEMMTNALASLFHYCGYVSERRGKPIENTRYWFDYCKADIDFINERHAPSWALEEVRMRYAQGITILHNHSNEWDIDQRYENWEVSLD